MVKPGAERIIVALDLPDGDAALDMVDMLHGHVGAFKVGLQLFTAEGPAVVRAIAARGERVFLDLKLHDIPNTMAGAAAAACSLGAWMITVHTAAGAQALAAVKSALARQADRLGVSPPLLLGVTLLTSIDEGALRSAVAPGSGLAGEDIVGVRARLAAESGLDGVVASPQEARALRRVVGEEFLIVTPGVRPSGAAAGDQKRFATPADAVAAGADYLVIGRPITRATDPRAAADSIAEEIEGAERLG